MRNKLSVLLKEAAKADSRVQVLSGDHGYALFDALRKESPGQFLNLGVSEQAMVGVGAGLAKSGLRPIIYGLAAFLPVRVLEFIKMDICYEDLPVILLGDGAGLVYSTLGASHQCGEDMAVLLPLPNLTVFSPADAKEMEYCMGRALSAEKGASYIRIGKGDKPAVHPDDARIQPVDGCIPVTKSLARTMVFATGSMVSTALELAQVFPLNVMSVPVPSDLSRKAVLELCEGMRMVATLEEHSVTGGLGSLVASHLAGTKVEGGVHLFGLQKRFTELASSYEVALEEHSLSLGQLTKRFEEIL